MGAGIGEQPDLSDVQIGQYLSTQADLAQNPLMPVVAMLAAAVQEEAVWVDAAVNFETFAAVVQVDQGAPSGLGNHFERSLYYLVAVAEGSAEDVSRQAVRVYPHQDWFRVDLRAHLASNQRQVTFSPVHFALIGDHAELAETRRHYRFRNAEDITLVLQTETDQLRYGQHFQLMLITELHQVRNTGHGAVIVHDLADHSRGNQPRHPREVDRSFSLAGTHQHPAAAGAQRKNVARPRQVRRGHAGVNRDLNGTRAIMG